MSVYLFLMLLQITFSLFSSNFTYTLYNFVYASLVQANYNSCLTIRLVPVKMSFIEPCTRVTPKGAV